MTPEAFRAILARLGFSGSEDFSRWIETDARTVRRWAADGPPGTVAKLLRLMEAEDYTPSDVDRAIRAAEGRRGQGG